MIIVVYNTSDPVHVGGGCWDQDVREQEKLRTEDH